MSFCATPRLLVQVFRGSSVFPARTYFLWASLPQPTCKHHQSLEFQADLRMKESCSREAVTCARSIEVVLRSRRQEAAQAAQDLSYPLAAANLF